MSHTMKKLADEKKKNQRANYSSDELQILEQAVTNYSKYVFGKSAPGKKMAYEAITNSINKISVIPRSVDSVKNRIKADISASKTKQMLIRECLEKTGGGPFDAPELTPYEELLMSYVKEEQLTGIEGGIDTTKKETVARFKTPFKKQVKGDSSLESPPATKKPKENCDPQPSKTTPKKQKTPTKASPVLKDPKRRRLLFGSSEDGQLDVASDDSLADFAEYVEEYDNGLQVHVAEDELKLINARKEESHINNNDNKKPSFETNSTQTDTPYVDKVAVYQQQENVVSALNKQSAAIEKQTEVLGNISNILQSLVALKSNVLIHLDQQ